MKMNRILAPMAFVASLILGAAPAYAGQHHGGGGGHSAGRSHAGGSRGGAVFHGGGTYRGAGPARSSSIYRGGGVVRGGVVRGGVVRGSVGIAPRVAGPRGFVGGAFYRPYYSFRPRFSLGFGFWAGYPVPYPYYSDYAYGYGYPYPYPVDPYAYGYAAPSYGYGYSGQPYPPSPSQGSAYGAPAENYPAQQPGSSVGVQQGAQLSAPGGISFEVTPSDAAVFVDGTYVGTAGTFGPKSQPLGLVPGRHTIEIRGAGYKTMRFDADITSGQVTPYEGALQRE